MQLPPPPSALALEAVQVAGGGDGVEHRQGGRLLGVHTLGYVRICPRHYPDDRGPNGRPSRVRPCVAGRSPNLERPKGPGWPDRLGGTRWPPVSIGFGGGHDRLGMEAPVGTPSSMLGGEISPG